MVLVWKWVLTQFMNGLFFPTISLHKTEVFRREKNAHVCLISLARNMTKLYYICWPNDVLPTKTSIIMVCQVINYEGMCMVRGRICRKVIRYISIDMKRYDLKTSTDFRFRFDYIKYLVKYECLINWVIVKWNSFIY